MTRSVQPEDPPESGRVDGGLDAPELVHHPAKRPGHEALAVEIALLDLIAVFSIAAFTEFHDNFENTHARLGICVCQKRIPAGV